MRSTVGRAVQSLVLMAAFAAVYVLTARIGFALAVVHPGVTLVWPPAGIALGAVLLLGARAWPAIAVAAFAANLLAGAQPLVALVVAAGNTAAALAGLGLARRVGRLDTRMERPGDVAALALLGVAPSAALSATVGVSALAASGSASWGTAGTLWLDWWLGDGLGGLVVTPLLLAWWPRRDPAATRGWWPALRLAATTAAVVAGLAAATAYSFSGLHVVRPYIVFPLALGAALWLGPRGATVATLVVATGVVWAAVLQVGPFKDAASLRTGLLTKAVFVAALAVSALMLAAVTAGRERARRAVGARSAQLEAVRRALREVVAESELDGLLGTIARQAAALTRAPAAGIFLLDPSGRTFVPRAWHGFGDWIRDLRVDREAGVGGLALERRRGLRIDDYSADSRHVPVLVTAGGVTAVAVEPLVRPGRELGTIFVAHDVPGAAFTAEDQETLALFADLVAIAIASADAAQARTAETDRRYRLLAEHTRDVIWTCDLEFRWTYVSPSIHPLRGYTVEEAMAQGLDAVMTPASRSAVASALVNALDQQSAHAADPFWSTTLELELTRRDGSTVWTETMVTLLRDAAGLLEGFLGVTRDIDERKRAELALAATRERLALIARASYDAIWEHDLLTDTLWWGDRVDDLFGYDSARLGTDAAWWRDGIHPDDRPRVLAGLEVVLGNGSDVWREEYRFRRADGGWAHVMDRGLVVRDAARRPLRMVGAMMDVTLRRAMEDRLRLQGAALEAAADAIVITDRQGVIQWVNPAFTALTGYASDEAAGQTMQLLRSGRQAPGVYVDLWATILEGRPWRGRLVNRRKDGSLYTEEQTITPVRDARGEIAAFIAIKQDITERLRTEEALAQQQRLTLQGEKMAEMGQLLAGVAHELNNPLSVVLGYAGLLQRTAPTAGLEGIAGKLDAATRRCARIVKNFLALARQNPPEKTTVSLNTIVTEAVELVAYPLRVDGVEVVLALDETLPEFLADPHQLQQVIVNLVTNACHALRETRGARRLTLATGRAEADRSVWLEVSDTGPGLAATVRDRLFQPFVTTKPEGEGTGLGLSICKGIVEGHGGTIAAASEPGQGTRFRITLPVGGPAPVAVSAAPPDEAPPPGGLSVLVVDDEPDLAAVLADLLRADGHRVVTADNGATALQRLVAGPIDAVLCDIRMPVMDGPELYAILRHDLPHVASRLAFVTGDTLATRTERFLAEAGRPVLTKPFEAARVRRLLREIAADGMGR